MSVAVGKNLRGPLTFWIVCLDGPLRTAWAGESLLSRTDVSGECYGR
jgi:hypothetical protein